MDEHRLVQVFWEGPLSLDEVLKRPDKGLYQVYGQHAVFGRGALLYVGMTDKQSFGARFKQHRDRWLKYEADVEIRVGVIRDGHSVKFLADVEALTIWWHSPPYNSTSIWQYKRDPLRVQNWEQRGSLHPEYSSHWREEAEITPPEGEVP
jgi:hypothetical protein